MRATYFSIGGDVIRMSDGATVPLDRVDEILHAASARSRALRAAGEIERSQFIEREIRDLTSSSVHARHWRRASEALRSSKGQ